MADTQTPAESNQNGPGNFDKIRLTIEDFTKLGLLTAEEIEEGENMCRVISVEDRETPRSASVTLYDDTYSPAGIRIEYNRTAEGTAPQGNIVKELTIEASIYNTSITDPSERYFAITGSERTRDADFNTATDAIISVNAKQDPEDPNSFIVEFAQNGPKMHAGRWQAKKFHEIVESLRAMQTKIQEKTEQVVSDPETVSRDVDLPLQP